MLYYKIKGHTGIGQGNDYWMVYSRNDVYMTLFSDDYAEPEFKYVLEDAETGHKFYLSPNQQQCGVFNFKPIFMELCNSTIFPTNSLTGTELDWQQSAVAVPDPTPVVADMQTKYTKFYIYEGYEIGGVWQEVGTHFQEVFFWVIDGEGVDNWIVLGDNGGNLLGTALTQMFDVALGYNDGKVQTRIPTTPWIANKQPFEWQRIGRYSVEQPSQSAFKVMTILGDYSNFMHPDYTGDTIDTCVINLLDINDNIINTITFDLFALGCTGWTNLINVPVGLRNLVWGGHITPTEAEQTAYYLVDFSNNTLGQITPTYAFWVEKEVRHNAIHLYWLNSKGGWDSFTFDKKNERSIDVDRKRYLTNEFGYNVASYSNPMSSGTQSRVVKERNPIVKYALSVSSDWLTESEFKFMRDLYTSKSVWMWDDNNDGGQCIPVVIEDNSYTMKRERNFKQYNISLKLQIANKTQFKDVNKYFANPRDSHRSWNPIDPTGGRG